MQSNAQEVKAKWANEPMGMQIARQAAENKKAAENMAAKFSLKEYTQTEKDNWMCLSKMLLRRKT